MCRLLKAEEIECRVAQVSAKGCSLLLYKTARVDRAILTETYGDLWQNDYKTIDGKMYGGIGIYNKELKEWIWRWDVGVESNTEAVKGESSDAFKRSAFRFGIGIELYSAPFIWINCDTYKDEYASKKANKDVYKLTNKFEKFDVKSIDYDANRNINKLVIVDSKGNTVYELGKYVKPEPESINNDIDLLAGLKACSDLENLKIYYQREYKNVVDKKTFEQEKDKIKKFLTEMEAKQ